MVPLSRLRRPARKYFRHYFGIAETSLGPGYLFEYIRNECGTSAGTVSQNIIDNNVSYAAFRHKLTHFLAFARHHGLLIHEVTPINLMVRHRRSGDFDLVLIDGFGPWRVRMKERLRARVRPLANYKTRRLLRLVPSQMDRWIETVRSGNPQWDP